MKHLDKKPAALIALVQSVGVVLYALAIASLMSWFGNQASEDSTPYMAGLILTLFVLSAGVTGFLVFGYGTKLAIEKNYQRALKIVGFTFAWLALIVIAGFLLLSA